ncbi:MAG: hypothetical protein M3O07_02340 [Pseudomonadota bacterium]|nr:hypothetical protein [Pseudomonadota bacterium]
MRRLTHALLLVLVLVTVQIAAIGHQHAADTLPASQQAAACDFCTGLHAAAPPPVISGAGHHAPAFSRLPAADLPLALPSQPTGAHRSRAPPAIHSI